VTNHRAEEPFIRKINPSSENANGYQIERVKLGVFIKHGFTKRRKLMSHKSENVLTTTMTRRSFAGLLLGAGALALVEKSAIARVLAETRRSMQWLASQNPSAEGVWQNLKVEGSLPRALNGTLFRVAPGQMDNHGTQLRHLFDGDALLSSWRFREGNAELRARFLPTPHRLEELKAGQMLYHEFGTAAPRRIAANSPAPQQKEGKNQASVNVVEWQGKFLGLSEGGLPTVINPKTFDFEGYWDFNGTVPRDFTFTAHPRFDPKTGDMFAYGFEKNMKGTLHVFRIDRQTGKAADIYQAEQNGFYMVHDAMLTENYFLIPVPPMKLDFAALMTGRAEVFGDALRYVESETTRLIVVPRDGAKEKAFTIQLPPNIIFHHGNAYETADGKIVFESILGNDNEILELLRDWKTDKVRHTFNNSSQTLTRITIDLNKRAVVGKSDLVNDVEFPRFDSRLVGQKSRFLYLAERGYDENAAIMRFDLQKGTTQKANAGKMRTFGEPVFVPKTGGVNEERGWILAQGYDAARNETFLEIRDAQTLEFEARVWAAGQHLPLGFHGNFYTTI
jgi:carotenoid cleavage dioxygenase-like enzyme